IPEQEQPPVFTFFFRPLELPFVISTKQVVFVDASFAGVFENQVEQHVSWRIRVVLWIVANLDGVELVPVFAKVVERNSFGAGPQEGAPELSQLDFALCDT